MWATNLGTRAAAASTQARMAPRTLNHLQLPPPPPQNQAPPPRCSWQMSLKVLRTKLLQPIKAYSSQQMKGMSPVEGLETVTPIASSLLSCVQEEQTPRRPRSLGNRITPQPSRQRHPT